VFFIVLLGCTFFTVVLFFYRHSTFLLSPRFLIVILFFHRHPEDFSPKDLMAFSIFCHPERSLPAEQAGEGSLGF
jgi:hypothetical protein